MMLMSATGWQIGIALGIVVDRGSRGDRDRDRAAGTADRHGRRGPRCRRSRSCAGRPTSSRTSRKSTTPACGSSTPHAPCERWRSGNDTHARSRPRSTRYWAIALAIGLGRGRWSSRSCSPCCSTRSETSRSRSTACSRSPARSPRTPRTSRSSRRQRPCSALIVDGGGRAGRLHERPHRRVRCRMSTTHVLALLSVVLAVVVVLVLAAALIQVRRGLMRISTGLATLGGRTRRRRVGAPAAARRSGHRDQRAVRHHPRRPARASRAKPRSSPRGGRNDALVDRRPRPARRDRARRRVPAARRARRPRRASCRACSRSRRWPRPARRTSMPPRSC